MQPRFPYFSSSYIFLAIATLLLSFSTVSLSAQTCTNLVPNGSFEDYSALPDDDCDWFLATGWTNAASTDFCNSTNGSPDYFHLLGSGDFSALPNNYFANIAPFEGDAIMGVSGYISFATDAREYLSIALSCPLIIGETYELQFQITEGTPNVGGFSVNGWGVALTEGELLQPAGCNCPIETIDPQFEIASVFTTDEWETINFTFMADAAYEYLTFGNFLTDAEQTRETFGSPAAFGGSYCFVDDFSLTLVNGSPPELDLGEDITECSAASSVVLDAGIFPCATYLWSTGENDSSITVTADGTYAVTVNSSCGTATDEITIAFESGVEQFLTASICEGESYSLNGALFTETGVYTQALTTSSGCDSLIILSLNVIPSAINNLEVSICPGETYLLNGQTYEETGTYTQSFSSSNGCDSLVVLNLLIAEEFSTSLEVEITAGEVYVLNDITYTEPGTYIQQLTTVNGCDSTLVLSLSLLDKNVFMPNVFSPNFDGVNDYLKPYLSFNSALRIRSMQVFNKWGGLVFEENTNPGSELVGWDGTFLSKPAEIGVYVFLIIMEQQNGETLSLSGDVMLLR